MSTAPKADDSGSETAKGFSTSEFTAAATAVVVNVLGLAAVLWHLTPDQVNHLQGSLVAIIGAVGVAGANAAVVWKFISGRIAVKTASINADASKEIASAAQSPDASALIAHVTRNSALIDRIDRKLATVGEAADSKVIASLIRSGKVTPEEVRDIKEKPAC